MPAIDEFGQAYDEAVAPKGFGLREDGTPKGQGWFGPLQMKDNSGKTATEMSLGFDFNGKQVLAPALVPTLTPEEVNHLLSVKKATPEIISKAAEHTKARMKQGLSPFKD